jgi:hypothetical protein
LTTKKTSRETRESRTPDHSTAVKNAGLGLNPDTLLQRGGHRDDKQRSIGGSREAGAAAIE